MDKSESPTKPDLTRRGTPRKLPHYIRQARHNAALSRWESVKRERFIWLRPFKELEITKALAYLEDLRSICEEAGHILNERINDPKHPVRCSGPRCGKSLEGKLPNGMPLWIAKKDFKDKNNPEIMHSLYFCSELCVNLWTRKQGGQMGNDRK